MDSFSLMLPGRLFHKVGATNLKALWPERLVLVSLALGASRRNLEADLRERVGVYRGINSERYGGSLSLTARNVDERTL
jgi:hypothetical protein